MVATTNTHPAIALLEKACRRLTKPTVVSLVSDTFTPVSVFNDLCRPGQAGFLFESAEGDARLARFSFTAADPLVTISLSNGTAKVVDTTGGQTATQQCDNPLELLQAATRLVASPAADPLLATLPFSGGLVGYLGYAATASFEKIAQQKDDPFHIPDGFYGLYDSLVVFDHQFRRLHIISRRGQAHAQQLRERIEASTKLHALPAGQFHLEDGIFANVQQPVSRGEFLDLVDKCKEYIMEGQVFQIVLSHRFSLPVKAAPLDIYRVLQAINPSPYAYFLQMPAAEPGGTGFSYIGSSPETFVRCQGGKVLLRAIAGTRPRGKTAEEDEALARELKSDEKELAEHHMLVDLGRNDLGRVCRPGTVRVGEIACLTRYTHVMHLATEVTGELAADKTCFNAFQGCFPRGTVSGAPKVRAMQLLAQLEPERRGIYSGVVGYFDFQANMDGAIAIRSALIKDGLAHINAGAGIVLDSKPESEYEETCNKARSIIKAVVAANRLVDMEEKQ